MTSSDKVLFLGGGKHFIGMQTLHTVEEQISFVSVTVTQLHVELIPTNCAKKLQKCRTSHCETDLTPCGGF